MPAGDAQRTWFPEMITALRREWRETMSCAELVELRDRLNAMLQAIRSERDIHPPMMKHAGEIVGPNARLAVRSIAASVPQEVKVLP